jgi:hypothetical protein
MLREVEWVCGVEGFGALLIEETWGFISSER